MNAASVHRQPRLIAYPRRGIAYCDQLYSTVAALGVEAVEGVWSEQWILRHVRRRDLVHIHWPSFLYFRSGAPFATFYHLLRFFLLAGTIRLLGARIVWTAHNLYPHDGGRNEWTHRTARRYITRVAQRIFAHGPTAAKIVGAEFGVDPEKITLVPHGHWRELYAHAPNRGEARRHAGLPDDAPIYGFVGSCRPYKNLESIIEAFARVDRNSHLLIAGEFSSQHYFETIRSMIAPEAVARVHIVDRFLGDDEIMSYVAGLDALVLSYKQVLTSGVAMLALSAGVPVVAPRIGGIPDMVCERTGVLYDPTMPDGLAEAMREVLRRTYSSSEIIAHAVSYDWNVSAAAIIELLES